MTQQREINFPIGFFGADESRKVIKSPPDARFDAARTRMQTNTSTKFIRNVENGKDTAHIGKVLLLIRALDLGTQLVDLQSKA